VSPQTRVRLLVATAALAAASLAAGVAAVYRSDGGDAAEPPPLELGIALLATRTDRELVEAERLYEQGERDEARKLFEAALAREPARVEARVGLAVASWPEGTVAALRAIAAEQPDSGVARLHLGLALWADGDRAGARAEWVAAAKVDPDSPAALRAEDLLHPEMPPGRPFFTPAATGPPEGIEELPPGDQLEELRRRAQTGGVEDWLFYGSVLQRLGRPLSARDAFDRAVQREPLSVEARTAAALARFDKNDPSQAFSRLGPLASANPDAAVVRFHLGLALLWLRDVDEARSQLVAARDAEPDSVWGGEAARLLERIDEATSGEGP
jgi:tetratricopeptide (TPR) repeat protein